MILQKQFDKCFEGTGHFLMWEGMVLLTGRNLFLRYIYKELGDIKE
jgi:hypothetical protein